MDLTGKLKQQRVAGKRRSIALLMLVSGVLASHAETLDLPDLTSFSDEPPGVFEPELESAKRSNRLFENPPATNHLKTGAAKPLTMAWLQNSIQPWLQQFGVSELTLGDSREHWPLSEGSFAWLYPWSQTDRGLLLTQCDFDYRMHQITFNIGMGYRWFNGTQGTWGSNLFYDHLIQDRHRRLGIGFEYSHDYFAVAFNGYWPLSDWQTTAPNEQAKPAPGVDIRLTGYLPNYPKLGITFSGEHYRGHDVALFGESAKQRLSNPLAASVSVEYTPVPLCRISYHYKLAKAGLSEHRYQLALTYQFDRSLTQQLDPAAVVYTRSLQHQPLGLVQRNNQLQLSYRPDIIPQTAVQPEALEQKLDQKDDNQGDNSEQDNKGNAKDSTEQPSSSELNISTAPQDGKELSSKEGQEAKLSSAGESVSSLQTAPQPVIDQSFVREEKSHRDDSSEQGCNETPKLINSKSSSPIDQQTPTTGLTLSEESRELLHTPWVDLEVNADARQNNEIPSGLTDSAGERERQEEENLSHAADVLLVKFYKLTRDYSQSIPKNSKKLIVSSIVKLRELTGLEDDGWSVIRSCQKSYDKIEKIVMEN